MTSQITPVALTNAAGDKVVILNYGGRIASWHVALENEQRNIILGYENLDDYLSDPAFHGAIAGPFANRIGGASFEIEGVHYQLAENENGNLLHSGPGALHEHYWQIESQSENSVVLTTQTQDGFNGFPGNVAFTLEYELSDDGALSIQMNASSDKATVVGPTSHPYFNLSNSQHIAGHRLTVNADEITEIDSQNIPTGELLAVSETRFDFNGERTLTTSENDHIDHNFVLNDDGDVQAKLVAEDGKVSLSVLSDYPGLQVYTGHGLTEPFALCQGVCLEPQFFPDSPNKNHFPFELTTPDKPFSQKIVYQVHR